MCQFFKKIFFVLSFFLITMCVSEPSQPAYSLDKVPFIPLPSEIVPSVNTIPLDAIKSIKIVGTETQLISMAQNFISFWKNIGGNF